MAIRPEKAAKVAEIKDSQAPKQPSWLTSAV